MPKIKDLPGFARLVIIQAQLLGVASFGLVCLSWILPFYLWSVGVAYDESYFRAAFWMLIVGCAATWVCDEVHDRVEDEIVWGDYGH